MELHVARGCRPVGEIGGEEIAVSTYDTGVGKRLSGRKGGEIGRSGASDRETVIPRAIRGPR
jgi:hypothetical protein